MVYEASVWFLRLVLHGAILRPYTPFNTCRLLSSKALSQQLFVGHADGYVTRGSMGVDYYEAPHSI